MTEKAEKMTEKAEKMTEKLTPERMTPERRQEIWKIGDWLRNGTDPDPLHAEPAHREDEGDPLDYNVCTAEGIAYCTVPALDDDFMTKTLAEAAATSGRVIHELLDHLAALEAEVVQLKSDREALLDALKLFALTGKLWEVWGYKPEEFSCVIQGMGYSNPEHDIPFECFTRAATVYASMRPAGKE